MSDGTFSIDEKTGTCSIHFDKLDPTDMIEISKRLKDNAKLMILMKKWDPIQVMSSTLRRDPNDGVITFQLAHNAPVLTIDSGWPTAPVPNVNLSAEQYKRYVELFNQVVS